VKVVTGDLVKLAESGAFDAIVHGCNCQCVMGAGIAKTIRARFPEAFEADRATTRADRAKLGEVSLALIERGAVRFHVVNAYTQFHWRGPPSRVDYDAVARAMAKVKQRFAGQRIGYPRIGAGLAGGDWSRLAGIIDEALAGEDHTLVEFSG
jgi:O-acetyl-ADP-ribose deacetylase (regulator of RNase III)